MPFTNIATLLFLFLIILLIIRNEWVFRKRMKILKHGGHLIYESLPSYSTMILKFWIWDINKFLK